MALDYRKCVEEMVMTPVILCSAGKVGQPVLGKVIPYTEIGDPVFAAGTLGQGVGIEPEDNVIYAPFDGEVSFVADSRHAIGIAGPGGMDLLIHVGMDTVAMKGDGFEPLVREGDRVKMGQKIMTFDRGKIKAAGHPETVAVLLTNSGDYDGVKFGEGIL
ncbi:MAG: PTS glucose transporter subunit IIA [Fretibacterium sp.]|nr:PTS glucose transporter subunit IIA [Fretibacterium sp.]